MGCKIDLQNSGISESAILKYSKKVSEIHKSLQERNSRPESYKPSLA